MINSAVAWCGFIIVCCAECSKKVSCGVVWCSVMWLGLRCVVYSVMWYDLVKNDKRRLKACLLLVKNHLSYQILG